MVRITLSVVTLLQITGMSIDGEDDKSYWQLTSLMSKWRTLSMKVGVKETTIA